MFKIKSQHEHQDFDCHPRRQITNQFQKVDIIPLKEQKIQPKKRKIRINSLPGQDEDQYIMVDALIPQLQQSIQLLSDIQFELISSKRKNLQKFVYISIVEDEKYYLSQLFRTENVKYTNFIQEVVSGINDTILGEILEGEHNVHKLIRPTKEEIFNGGTRVTQAAIKIRQSMIKAKLSDLKADINVSNLNLPQSSFLNLNSADLYSQNSYRTKQAKQFVKKMQQLQQSQKRQKQLKEENKRKKKYQQQYEKRQMEERIRLQKHQYLKKQFQEKRQAKQQQKRQHQNKSMQFKKFLQQYKSKVPLFIQKQKQYHLKVQIPQNKKKFQILKQIKQQRRPLDHDQLKQHQRSYLQIKQDYIYEKNAARALEQKARKKPDKQLPKSKFHALIQKQQQQKKEIVDELQLKTKMYDKRIDYSNQVKTRFRPKIDLNKRQQLIKKSEQLNWVEKVRINRSLHMDSYKKDGKDNLDKLHKYIAELKAKGKILTSTSRTIQSSPQTNSVRYKNYLHELRQLQTSSYMRPSRTRSIDYSSLLSNTEQAQKVKINLKKKQESAMRRQQYIANLGSRNLQKYMQQKKKLDDDYLDTVKAKMAIINKFQ